MQVTSILVLLLSHPFVSAQKFVWPEKNQQCADDAGPPYLDDKPGKKYHDVYPKVSPVLLPDGSCADPLKEACGAEMHGDAKTAYLEGPVSCNNEGWYCRITEQEGWRPMNLKGDLNFGHCNSTASFDDDATDADGHCHGSSVDNTYYWWIRDHFFRQYNGKLRCCCGWFEKDEDGKKTVFDAITSGRIGNGCDYRREVFVPDKCRDANEDNTPPYDRYTGGCKKKFKKTQLNKPVDLPKFDNTCWEIQYFGAAEGTGNDDEGDDDEGDDYEECEDEKGKFFLKKKKGKIKAKSCDWLNKKSKKKIKKYCSIDYEKAPEGYDVANTLCWETCKTCDER